MHFRCISRMRCRKHTDVPDAEQTRNLLQKPQKQATRGTKAEKSPSICLLFNFVFSQACSLKNEEMKYVIITEAQVAPHEHFCDHTHS